MKGFFAKIKGFFGSLTHGFFVAKDKIQPKINAFFVKHPRVGRVYNLTSLQLSNSSRFKVPEDLLTRILARIGQVLLFGALIAIFTFGISLYEQFVLITSFIDNRHLVFLLSVYTILTILEMSASLVNTMYKAKDNAILMSFPVHPGEIFVSKLLAKYVKELKKALFVVLPFLVAFFINRRVTMSLSWLFLPKIIPVLFFLPLFLVLFSGFLSILFSMVDTLFKKFGILKLVFTAILIIGAFAVLLILIDTLPQGTGIHFLWYRITTGFESFLETVDPYLPVSYWTVRFLIGGKWWVTLIVFVAMLAVLTGLFFLNYGVSFRFFFRLATNARDSGGQIKKRVTSDKLRKSTFMTFFMKELKIYLRSDEGMTSTLMFVLILPLLVASLNKLFLAMNISQMGRLLVICVNILISCTVLTATNIAAANALSREGSEFYLLKVSPLNTRVICLAKLALNGILLLISTLAMGVGLSIVCARSTSLIVLQPMDIIFISVISLVVGLGHLLWSFELDLTHPKIQQYKAGDKDNSNLTKSLFLGILLSVLFTIATYFYLNIAVDSTHLFLKDGHDPASYAYRWPLILLVALIFAGSRAVLFVKRLRVCFDELEA